MMTLIAAIVLVLVTIPVVAIVVFASFLGVPMRHGSIYEKVQWFWATSLTLAGGVRRRIHGAEHIEQEAACVYVANHVSWYDVFVLASVLPRWSFVAKAELRKIPIFGRGAEAVGMPLNELVALVIAAQVPIADRLGVGGVAAPDLADAPVPDLPAAP
jgi:1-acyl-sn-glycerol-3-phosphate acyltransferase